MINCRINFQRIDIPGGFQTHFENWLSLQPVYALFHSNGYCNPYGYSSFEYLAAWDAKETIELKAGSAFETLQNKWTDQPDWWFGFFGYDLKNEVERLQSRNEDYSQFPDIFFFRPGKMLMKKNDGWYVAGIENTAEWIKEVTKFEVKNEELPAVSPFLAISKEKYLGNVDMLRAHIAEGDIYEINYCVQFRAEANLSPMPLFQKLRAKSPMPYSGLLHWPGYSIVSASPERFLKKTGHKLIAQPIKGTSKRGNTPETDRENRRNLYLSEKDRAENVMIVDLTRNDLTHFAQAGTVKVEDLFGVYAYPRVHHMISTISATLTGGTPLLAALRQAFPMGSMTGAPKVRAMQLIDEFEDFKRGPFSGALGYLDPDGNFDFNVLIRSIFQNHQMNRLAFCAGGAITWDSTPADEWDELHLKASAIQTVLAGG